MIYAYGVTLQGTSHIKDNTVCQDAHKIIKCGKDKDMVIAAVADGIGSEEHSDVASEIAVRVSTDYCEQRISSQQCKTDEEILDTIKASFSAAKKAIEEEAKTRGHTSDQYGTTLSLAVFTNGALYYGHVGDSGIVALTTEGLYKKVTEQQRNEYGNTFHLFSKEKWLFGHFDEKICSVFLATDGMLEPLFPNLIKNEPVSIHVKLAQYFIDNRSLKIDNVGEATVQARVEDYLRNIPHKKVNDDKTVVVLVDPSVESKIQPEAYYKEPDWTELERKFEEEWKRKAYPHLFKDENADVSEKTVPHTVMEKTTELSMNQIAWGPSDSSSRDATPDIALMGADKPTPEVKKEQPIVNESEAHGEKCGFWWCIFNFFKKRRPKN